MSTSLQLRDAAAQTDEDIFFDAPEELFEDALEYQEVRCIETHPYLVNPEKDHYPDLPTLTLRDEIQSFNCREPAPYDVNDPEYEVLMVIEDCLTNLQEQYDRNMEKEDSRFRRIMALYEKVINRPHDSSRMLTPEARKKERAPYVRRLNEITRLQKLMDREYLVEFTELKKDAVAIMDKWHSKQSSLAEIPQKLVVEERIRWKLLKQKQLEYIHDKTKKVVHDQANRIRDLEYALAVAQQVHTATPFIYHETRSMTEEEILAGASNTIQEQVLAVTNNMTEERVLTGASNPNQESVLAVTDNRTEEETLADAYEMMRQQRMNHGGQNAVQLNAHVAQVDDAAVPNGQEQLSAEENIAQAQQPHDFQNYRNPELTADSEEINPSTIADGQQEALEEINLPQSREPWNFQDQERLQAVANGENNDDDTVLNVQNERIEEGEIAEVEQPVNFQLQEVPEPDTNLPQDQSDDVASNGQEELIATGANNFQGQEHVYDNTQEVQQPANALPLDAAVPIIPNRQVKQHSYVNYMEHEHDVGRMYPLHSSDPVKKAWARKKLDLDFEKKERDTMDEIMQTGRNKAALKKWAETVSGLAQEVSPDRRPTTHIIREFDENEASDDEYGRKRTFGTYEEDDVCEEEHSRKRVRPITRITRGTPVSSIIFEPTPDDSSDEEMWEAPAIGYVGHDGVYYDADGQCQYTQAHAGEEYFDSVNDGGYPVHQYTQNQPQQQSPSPENAPASRIRSYVPRATATKCNGSAPARLSRERMLRSQWTLWQNNLTTPR